jgi:1,4-dihydroxy-2-naphthoyl-CoA hydrolase
MFTYSTQVHLKDTDATGVLYFSEQFKFALEAFEAFLQKSGFAWKDLLSSPYLLPVVHAEADYLAPITCGDPLDVKLTIASLGTSSITLHYTFCDPSRDLQVGRAEIIHVVVDRQTRKSVPIPDFLRAILAPISLANSDNSR